MGSNTVSLTDRAYMLRLQSRILEDYATAMDKRIKVREVCIFKIIMKVSFFNSFLRAHSRLINQTLNLLFQSISVNFELLNT